MKISGTILQLLSLALVGGLAFCGGFQLNEMVKAQDYKLERDAVLRLRRVPPVEVAVMELQPRPYRERIALTGMVHPWRSARLAFQEAGRIASLAVDKGERVQGPTDEGPGQKLAAIDQERFAAALDSARAARDQAKWDLEQVEDLHRQGSASEQQLRQARLLLDQREAELRLAAESHRNTRLLAPFPGTIAERHVELGESVKPQQPAFRLVDQSRVKVVVHVPGRRIGEVARGQEAEIEATPERGEPFHLAGRVHHIPTTAKELLFPV